MSAPTLIPYHTSKEKNFFFSFVRERERERRKERKMMILCDNHLLLSFPQHHTLNRNLLRKDVVDAHVRAVDRSNQLNDAVRITFPTICYHTVIPESMNYHIMLSFETILRDIDPLGRTLTKEEHYVIFIGAGKIQVGQCIFDTEEKLYYIGEEENLIIFARSCVFLSEVPASWWPSWPPQDVLPESTAAPTNAPTIINISVEVAYSDGTKEIMSVQDALIKQPGRLESAFAQHCLNLPHSSEAELK